MDSYSVSNNLHFHKTLLKGGLKTISKMSLDQCVHKPDSLISYRSVF